MSNITLEEIDPSEDGYYEVVERYRDAGVERPSPLDLELFDLIERDNHQPLSFTDALEKLQSVVGRGARADAHNAYIGHWTEDPWLADNSPFGGEAKLFTPLEYAAFNDQPKWVRLFKQAGLPARDKAVSRLAVVERHLAFVWALHDADALELGVSGETTLLHLAMGCPELIVALVAWGADIRAVDEEGRSALHYCQYRSWASIEHLLRAGADPNVVAADGQTAFAALVARSEERGTRYFGDPDDRIVFGFMVAGLDLEAPVRGKKGLIPAREWIEESGYAYRASKLLKESGDVRLAAARELLQESLAEPTRPPVPRPQLPHEAGKAVVRRECRVSDRIVFVSKEAGHHPNELEAIELREHLPRARDIDRAVFELIERDATAAMPPGVALAGLQHLVRLGARLDCVQCIEICDEFSDPEDPGPLRYDEAAAHFVYFTPLQLAAVLNVPRWVGVFKKAGLPLADESAAVSAAAHGRGDFLQAMHEAGALSPLMCTAALGAAVRSETSLETIELLIGWGADVNAAGALSDAWFGKLEVIKALLAAGANPNAADSQGQTPFARQVRHAQMSPDRYDESVALYLAHGADPGAMLPREEVLGFGNGRGVATTARAIIEGQPMPRAQTMLRIVDARRAAQIVLQGLDAKQAEQLGPQR